MSYMDKKELNDTAPSGLRYSIRRIETGASDLSVELFRLARQGYLFIGGAVHREKREPKNVQILNMRSMVWHGLRNQGFIEHGGRVVAATNLGEIAICAALFGDLNDKDERSNLGTPLVSHGPPFYGFREMSPSQKKYDIFATPQLINVAQLMGPALKGYIDIVHGDEFTLTHEVLKGMYYGGIYIVSQEVQTIGTIEIDGTDLPSTVQPRNFPSIPPPLDLEF